MSAELPVDASDDPRLHTDHVRHLPGSGDGDAVTLVGVVHDHPASRYRVHELVAALDPAVLAVEVAPLALPLFEGYAADGGDLPTFGGEVSAAIASAEDARVVGIDGVDAEFLATLARTVVAERPEPATLSRVAASVLGVVRNAATCRLGAAVTAATGLRLAVDDPVAHETTLADPPERQAADERSQLTRSLTLLRCADPPEPIRLRDDVRDRCMADRLDDLRADGDVVAVVGRGHLDPLAERLGE
jgi:pheromone shutdown protein TraB